MLAYENGRTIDDSHVRAHCQAQLEALRGFDEANICAGVAPDDGLRIGERGDGPATNRTLDGPQSCDLARTSLQLARQEPEQTGGLLKIDFQYDIRKIEIAPDGRSATVEATSTAKVGQTLVSRQRGRETLSRSFWRIRSHGGESQVWSYGG